MLKTNGVLRELYNTSLLMLFRRMNLFGFYDVSMFYNCPGFSALPFTVKFPANAEITGLSLKLPLVQDKEIELKRLLLLSL